MGESRPSGSCAAERHCAVLAPRRLPCNAPKPHLHIQLLHRLGYSRRGAGIRDQETSNSLRRPQLQWQQRSASPVPSSPSAAIFKATLQELTNAGNLHICVSASAAAPEGDGSQAASGGRAGRQACTRRGAGRRAGWRELERPLSCEYDMRVAVLRTRVTWHRCVGGGPSWWRQRSWSPPGRRRAHLTGALNCC